MKVSSWRILTVVFYGFVLSACGGGGGSAGGNAGGISLSATALTFSAAHDDPEAPPPQTITITGGGGVNGNPMYAKVEWVDVPARDVPISCNNSNQCVLTVYMRAPHTFTTAGTFSGPITVIGCLDSACNSPSSSKSFKVTYTITPGMAATPGGMTFVSEDGTAPAPQKVTFTHPTGALSAWQSHIQYLTTDRTVGRNWLTLSPATGAAGAPSGSTVQVSAAPGMPRGNHQATISFSWGGGRVHKVSVTYRVTNAPAPVLTYVIDESTTSSALSQTAFLESYFPYGSGNQQSWKVTKIPSWLTISQSSGSSVQDKIKIDLSPAALAKIPKGIHRGEIEVTPAVTNGFEPFKVLLDLDMRLPLAAFVSPHAVRAGQSGEVYLRGSGLASLSGTVFIDGAPAVSSVRDDDTQIRFVHGALSAGDHAIDVGIAPNALGLNRSPVVLAAMGNSPFGATNIATTGAKRAGIYDERTQTLYVANNGSGVIERFRHGPSGWSSDGFALQDIEDLAMLPDGRALVAVARSRVTYIDLATFSASRTFDMPLTAPDHRGVAVGNDGIALISRTELVNGNTVAATLLEFNPAFQSFTATNHTATGGIRPARSGSKLFVLDYIADNLLVYDTLTRGIATHSLASSPPSASTLATSNDGKFLTGARLWRSDITYEGFLSVPGNLRGAALSPDGSRGFVYEANARALHVFDISTTGVQELRAIALSPDPGSSSGRVAIVATSDNRRVFVVGDTRMHVVDVE